ncbi:MAG: hypothetical protein IPL49_01835 [Saprospirales bacterium]|nr:hypothetical protein [Saprospirales bacterium]
MGKAFYILLFFYPLFLLAQPAKKWNPDLLTGVVWSFEMTYETGSGDLIERADTSELCDLLLDASHSFELFDRDQLRRGSWDLQGDILQVPFRGIDQFRLGQLSIDQLELYFTVGRTQYAHRFVRQIPVPSASASNETPVNKKNHRTWIDGEREIRIELTGGGFFGGADPVQRDFILIKENGRLIHERQTVNTGLRVDKKTLSRRQLADLADFIRANGFFDMETRYGCTRIDCENRLLAQPKPIPLRLAVSDGLDRHVVEVGIWPVEEGTPALLTFPPALKAIVDAIKKVGE